jgi:hypothetical protein
VNSLTRLIWRFALAHSDESGLKNLVDDDAALVGVGNDPSSVARFMRSMGSELGEEAGPEFDQTIEEMEHGGATARLRSGQPIRTGVRVRQEAGTPIAPSPLSSRHYVAAHNSLLARPHSAADLKPTL